MERKCDSNSGNCSDGLPSQITVLDKRGGDGNGVVWNTAGTSRVPVVRVAANSRNYYMNHESRGLFLIFNHKKFRSKDLPERRGTEVDREALFKMALALGFRRDKIRVFNDLTRAEIDGEIEKARGEDHTDADCIVCCVLTHGEEDGSLHAYDGSYAANNLFEPFEGNNCATLRGKPKIFFLEACYGRKTDSGLQIKTLEHDGDENIYTLPNTADFLIHRSTVPGYIALLNEVHGAGFIQALTQIMIESAQAPNSDDLLSLLTVVNRKVAYEFESRNEDPALNRKKQVSSVYHTLTRKIYFSSMPSKTVTQE